MNNNNTASEYITLSTSNGFDPYVDVDVDVNIDFECMRVFRQIFYVVNLVFQGIYYEANSILSDEKNINTITFFVVFFFIYASLFRFIRLEGMLDDLEDEMKDIETKTKEAFEETDELFVKALKKTAKKSSRKIFGEKGLKKLHMKMTKWKLSRVIDEIKYYLNMIYEIDNEHIGGGNKNFKYNQSGSSSSSSSVVGIGTMMMFDLLKNFRVCHQSMQVVEKYFEEYRVLVNFIHDNQHCYRAFTDAHYKAKQAVVPYMLGCMSRRIEPTRADLLFIFRDHISTAYPQVYAGLKKNFTDDFVYFNTFGNAHLTDEQDRIEFEDFESVPEFELRVCHGLLRVFRRFYLMVNSFETIYKEKHVEMMNALYCGEPTPVTTGSASAGQGANSEVPPAVKQEHSSIVNTVKTRNRKPIAYEEEADDEDAEDDDYEEDDEDEEDEEEDDEYDEYDEDEEEEE